MNKTGIQRFVPDEHGDSRLCFPDGIIGFWVWETTIHDTETPDVALWRAMQSRIGEHHHYRVTASNDAASEDEQTIKVKSVFDYEDGEG